MKICSQCSTGFEVTDADRAFYDRVSPIFADKKVLIPSPTLCPECRQHRRLAFRNERNLFSRNCDHCGKHMVTIYSPDKPLKVYCYECWWSDSHEPLAYGRPVTFDRPFFDQLSDLMRGIPRIALIASNNEKSEYVNFSLGCKNCYLIMGWGEHSEDCYYGRLVQESRNCVDVEYGYQSELCYDSIGIGSCYACFFSENCRNCSNGYFLKDCQGCRNCFGCVNLTNQEYRIFNVQYTKENYQKEMAGLLSEIENHSGLMKMKERVRSFFAQEPRKYYTGFSIENSVGDYLRNCKNAHQCFDVHDCEDVKYLVDCLWAKDCQDLSVAGDNHTELSYECVSYTGNHNLFMNTSWLCSDQLYTQETFPGSHDNFGCVGLKKNQYCILNKQYTKAEYEALVPKIIEHMRSTSEWGEFFSPALSPFGYNETMANEYFPLTRDQAATQGYNWSDYEAPVPQAEKVITLDQMKLLPERIKDTPDDMLSWVLTCEISGKRFKIVKPELEFYREHHLPLPRRHPDQRHKDRLALRNPRHLWARACAKCQTPIQTTYAPERPEKVYCESCYLKEVY